MILATVNLNIATSKLEHAVSLCETLPDGVYAVLNAGRAAGKTAVTLDIAAAASRPGGRAFLQALEDDSTDLTRQQRLQVRGLMGDRASLADGVVKTTAALEKVLKALIVPGEPTVEIQIGGRWYPVPATRAEHRTEQYQGSWCSFACGASVCGLPVGKDVGWSDSDFRDPEDKTKQRARTVSDLLAEEGIRIASHEAVEEGREKIDRAEKVRNRHGLTMSAKGSVLIQNKFLWRGGLEAVALGTEEKPRRVIVEPALEKEGDRGSHYGYGTQEFALPMVRVFSLDLKKYAYADVDDVEVYEFDDKAGDRLRLPAAMRGILDRVFDAPSEKIFGDLFKGRHGGMVVLANGPQGTGKTLTAEVFAEKTERPLYVLEMDELGTDLKQVEESLQRVFVRAARWNAVLLFDEADVFLARRAEADLERSAIVGVFLRLLDRYEGMFFLTTNRADVIDPAFRSRITLALEYLPLDRDARVKVWDDMLASAGLQVDGDMSAVHEAPLDGRQIRNQVRLLSVLARGPMAAAEVLESLKYVAMNKA
jgi:chloramphenicol 3-O-phosphotransferase